MNWNVLRVVHASERLVAQQIPGSWYPMRAFIVKRGPHKATPLLRTAPLVHGLVFVTGSGFELSQRQHVIGIYSHANGQAIDIPDSQLQRFRGMCEHELSMVQLSYERQISKRTAKTERRQWRKMDMASLSEALQGLLGAQGFEIDEAA